MFLKSFSLTHTTFLHKNTIIYYAACFHSHYHYCISIKLARDGALEKWQPAAAVCSYSIITCTELHSFLSICYTPESHIHVMIYTRVCFPYVWHTHTHIETTSYNFNVYRHAMLKQWGNQINMLGRKTSVSSLVSVAQQPVDMSLKKLEIFPTGFVCFKWVIKQRFLKDSPPLPHCL